MSGGVKKPRAKVVEVVLCQRFKLTLDAESGRMEYLVMSLTDRLADFCIYGHSVKHGSYSADTVGRAYVLPKDAKP